MLVVRIFERRLRFGFWGVEDLRGDLLYVPYYGSRRIFYHEPFLEVTSRVTMLISHIRGRITLFLTTHHEP